MRVQTEFGMCTEKSIDTWTSNELDTWSNNWWTCCLNLKPPRSFIGRLMWLIPCILYCTWKRWVWSLKFEIYNLSFRNVWNFKERITIFRWGKLHTTNSLRITVKFFFLKWNSNCFGFFSGEIQFVGMDQAMGRLKIISLLTTATSKAFLPYRRLR